jgi:hypothetical protein
MDGGSDERVGEENFRHRWRPPGEFQRVETPPDVMEDLKERIDLVDATDHPCPFEHHLCVEDRLTGLCGHRQRPDYSGLPPRRKHLLHGGERRRHLVLRRDRFVGDGRVLRRRRRPPLTVRGAGNQVGVWKILLALCQQYFINTPPPVILLKKLRDSVESVRTTSPDHVRRRFALL